MSHTLTLTALIISIVFGLLGQKFFHDGDFGLNTSLYLLAILATIAILRTTSKNPLLRHQQYLLAFSVVFACSFAVYRSEVILFNSIGLVIAAMLGLCINLDANGKHRLSVQVIDTIKYSIGIFFMPVVATIRVISLLSATSTDQPAETTASKNPKSFPIGGILQGLLIAVPLLWLFGSLLMSADARFDQWLSQLLNFNIPSISEYIMQVTLFSLISLGILYSAVLREKQSLPQAANFIDKPNHGLNNKLQILTVLTCVNTLFFAYIIVQLGYFFGGKELVQDNNDISYSLYARDGFWQLVWVAMFAIPLLYLTHWLQDDNSPSQSKKLNWISKMVLTSVALIGLIEISAVHRMTLYVSEYGLTSLRFYSSWYMAFIFSALIIFSFVVIRNYRPAFFAYLGFSALTFIALLNIANPERIIAKANIDDKEISEIDYRYLRRLSVDAHPYLFNYAKNNSNFDICKIVPHIKGKLKTIESRNWRSWNMYDQKARGKYTYWLKNNSCDEMLKP